MVEVFGLCTLANERCKIKGCSGGLAMGFCQPLDYWDNDDMDIARIDLAKTHLSLDTSVHEAHHAVVALAEWIRPLD